MARLLIKTEGLNPPARELHLGVNHVGRDPGCELHLNHATVSSRHGELALSADGVHLRDCGSTNGTFLNGVPVTEAWLEPGQNLRFGDVELFVESTEVTIAIPKLEREIVKPPVMRENGALDCPRHAGTEATFKCTHCQEIMCNACVRMVRMKGGKPLLLCCVCHQKCERIGGEKPKQKKGFFGFLQQTVRLKFTAGKPKP